MRRIAKVLARIASSIFVICVVLSVYIYVAKRKDVRKAADDQKVCDSRLAQLRHDLPVGTTHDEVLRYLQAHGQHVLEFSGTGDGVSTDLGKIQSTVWFCSFFVEYADFSFVPGGADGPDRILLAQINTRSLGECL